MQSHACIHTYIHYIHYNTYITNTYIHTLDTYITYISLSHTHHLSRTTLSHTTVFTSRSFATSFVFPSFPIPATTSAHYWKKLTCGVIRSFNFLRCFGPFGGKGFHLSDVRYKTSVFYVVLGSRRGPGVEKLAS